MNAGARKAFKYVLLPGVLPRGVKFFSSGFSHIALFMACAFHAVRLLPAGHPYLSPSNTGRFGIRHVLAEARRNVVFKKENADQVIIYYALFLGIFLLFFQFGILIAGLVAQTAHAAGIPFNVFSTPNARNDVAFVMLDFVFGVRGIFVDSAGGATCIAANVPCFNGTVAPGPWPQQIHTALQTLFQFYNLGVLSIGLIIFIYLVTTVAAETAQTGTPFGHRFNRMWAPLRMIVALALLTLIPYGGGQFGLNVAQLLTLHVANWGSGLATNAWTGFNNTLSAAASTPMGDRNRLVVKPQPPQFNTFLEFMFVAHTCRFMEGWENGRNIRFYQVRDAIPSMGVLAGQQLMPGTAAAALGFSFGKSIIIRVGEHDPVAYARETGNVAPICGEFTLPVKFASCATNPGGCSLLYDYYTMMQFMTVDPSFVLDAQAIAQHMTMTSNRDSSVPLPNTASFATNYINFYDGAMDTAINNARAIEIGSALWLNAVTGFGWGGAGMWYNRIAQYNGSFVAAAFSLPVVNHYPAVMENVKTEREGLLNTVPPQERYNPSLPGGTMVNFQLPSDATVALALYRAQRMWKDVFELPKGSFLADTIISLFGLRGLFNMYENADVHPMAQITGIGRSLVESAATNLGIAFGTGALGGIANIAGMANVAGFGMGAASMMGQIGLVSLSIGFVLYYIVPLLPFIYFFFAVGIWVKTIFEAMIGLPLWAMAHIRIDGEGLPGSAAMDGYYLIFEILIRPILIVFGLVAGLIIFGAQVTVLHEIWGSVVSNIFGFDTQSAAQPAAGSGQTGSIDYIRGAVDGFFVTIVYTIIVYMMAVSSFKLIDILPDGILRWMGASVASYGMMDKDPAESLVQYSFLFTNTVSGKIGESLDGLKGLAKRNS